MHLVFLDKIMEIGFMGPTKKKTKKGEKKKRILSGKSVFLNSKFQIQEFHAHCME